nr:BrnT family toxin [Methyloglobulus morosus]
MNIQHDDVIRIISARKATATETATYVKRQEK